jgi:plastocyanin
MKKLSILLAALALAAFGLAACGDDAEESDDETTAAESTEATAPTETQAAGGGGAGATIDLSSPADGSFAYDQTELAAAAGPVTINYDNPAPLSHDVVVEDEEGTIIGKTDLVSGDSTSTTVDLQAGTYTYFCDVPGHRGGGMEGTLTVE